MLVSRRQLGGFVCTLMCACFAVPALASAGSYQVVACDSATTANGAASGSTYANNSWTYSPPSDTSMWTSFSSCPSSGSGTYTGFGAYDVLGTVGGAPSVAWTFTAPSGTTVTSASTSRWIGKDGEVGWRPYGMADGTIFETCDYDTSLATECELSGTYSGDPGNATISYGFYCERVGCLNGYSPQHSVWVAIYSATITLSESVAPSLGISSSEFSDSGYLIGAKSVSFSGTDARGIRKAELYIDGALKATSTNSLCDYTFVNPCSDPSGASTTWNSSVSYDVTSLSDGDHSAYLRVYDAADNTTDSDTWSFTTDKTAPTPTIASSHSDGSGTFSVAWTYGTQVSPVTTSYYKLCQGSSCSATQTTTATSLTNQTLSEPGSWTFYVWGQDEAGNLDDTRVATASFIYADNTGAGAGSGEGDSGEGGSGSGTDTGSGTTGGESGTGTESGTGSSTGTDTGSGGSSGSTGSDSGSSNGTDTTTETKSSTRLKIKSAKLRGGRLTVKGTCARHSYSKRFRLSYDPAKGGTLRKSFRCVRGRWSVTLKVGTRGGGKVRASYAGDGKVSRAAVSRRVRR